MTLTVHAQAKILAQVEAAGLPVLWQWDLLRSQWDVHVAKRTLNTYRRGYDCTHFCMPSGVSDAMVDALLLTLYRRV